ncbi:helix-turn-helix transcriptional regulator [Bradyrhizobium sp. UFLA05-153]
MLDLQQQRAAFRQFHMNPPAYSSILTALDLIGYPAIWLDRDGSVLAVSDKALQTFDGDFTVRERRICVADYQSRMKCEELMGRVRLVSEEQGLSDSPVVINRASRRPLVLKAIRGDWASCSLPCETGVLLLLTDLDEVHVVSQASLMEIFGLTPVQAQLASLLVRGKSLEEIAREMRISSGTARHYLKAIFVRTATRRQAELALLLSRLR